MEKKTDDRQIGLRGDEVERMQEENDDGKQSSHAHAKKNFH